MIINLRKLISDLLMTFTRDVKIIEVIRVLTQEADVALNAFNQMLPDWMYKAQADASVISLQHHIKRELDVDAVITPLDGKPIDYLVTCTGFVDYSQVAKLLETYALAGRSYVFEMGEPIYSHSFINHVCELDLIDNKISLKSDGDNLYLEAEHVVTTNVNITVEQTSQGTTVQADWVISAGETINDDVIGMQFWQENQIISVTPVADEIYRYTFDNAIITNPNG